MAHFIGSNLRTDNWGEDYVIQKCIEYFDDSCIIYRNREVFGTQFDICILLPNQGIAVIEVKAWRPTTILRTENGDSIVIKTANGEEVSTSPIKQARGYVFSLRNKIRQKTGKTPFVFPVVCFPQITLQDYKDKHLEPVCEIETTLLKEDLTSKAALYNKMNLAMRNGQRTLSYYNPFNEHLMLQVRQLFESELDLKSLNSVYTRSGQNSTPNSNATNLHSSQKRCCSFCISSSNASPTFQVQKSIFHQMTKPIQVTVILPLLLAISFSRNDDIHSSISGISNDLIGVIPTIGQ